MSKDLFFVPNTELRIGNLVRNHDGLTVKINEWNIRHMFRSIPLDDTQISLMGLKQLDKYSFYKNGFFIHKRKRGYVLKRGTPILKSVHQVQNLYFALKGKELF